MSKAQKHIFWKFAYQKCAGVSENFASAPTLLCIYTHIQYARASTNLARVNRGRGGARTHGAKRAWRAAKLFAKERLIAQRAKSEKRERVKAKAHTHTYIVADATTQKDSFSLYRTLRILLQSACAKTVHEYACAAEGVGGGVRGVGGFGRFTFG